MKLKYNIDFVESPDRGEVFTPITLVEEMLDKLPKEVFESETTTFLDPCFGTGTFLKAIGLRLKAAGHSSENINSRLFGFEIDSYLYNETKIRMPYINISEEDFLKVDIDMKFDVIVGNPPYQTPGTSGKKLWKTFYIKSINLLHENGYLAYLTPSSFLKRSGKAMESLRDKIKSDSKLLIVDNSVNEYFNVGEDIVFTLLKKEKTTNQYQTRVIFFENNSKIIESQNISKTIMPSFGKEDFFIKSIFSKFLSTDKKIRWKEDINNSQAKMVRDGILSETLNEEYNHPVIYTPNTTHYTSELFGSKDSLKLMVTIAGTYYDPIQPNRNIFITTAMSGQGMCHIEIDNENEGNNIKSFLTSKLYRFYINKEKTSGYNTGLGNLPILDINKQWSDLEIYEYFKLTQEEIDYIENAVK